MKQPITEDAAHNNDTGSVLGRLQRGLESLYRVQTNLDVQAFVVDEAARARALAGSSGSHGTARRPREQLLIEESNDELKMALFVDAQALNNLQRHDPAQGLVPQNFNDFCLAVEGVSHFIYVAVCAAGERSVSALELELQAEVDKFVTCLLMANDHHQNAPRVRSLLFDEPHFANDLSAEEHDRYVTAHRAANAYAHALHKRYLVHEKTTDMLAELRGFYRFSLDAKLNHIARAA
ncbi:MAG: hypothetical protein SF187_04220 [Deltaproteobacteria bacterium]|nr:hypothetical protein [Deltaproteobacteria bacterium]